MAVKKTARKSSAQKGSAKKRTPKQKVLINFILDRSGSMMTGRSETINGFNHYVSELKKDKKTNYSMTLTQFDDKFETNYTALPLAKVEKLTEKTFLPRGWTALYDAIGKTVRETESLVDKTVAVLTVIFTDGYENASRVYTMDGIRRLIDEKQEANWTFVFLGANQDSYLSGRNIGIRGQSLTNYQPMQAMAAMSNLAGSTVRYSKTVTRNRIAGASLAVQDFFNDDSEDKNKTEVK